MTKKTPFHIFFSWQSDSPRETNHGAIGKALKAACKKLGVEYPDLTLVSDEATRGTSGSPRIVDKIVEKIEAAGMFVADITTVTAAGAGRPCPNPNVIFELGYAVATLGWDRVVLLFNGAIGSFPGDLPFDLAGNRTSRYDLAVGCTAAQYAKLEKLMEVAVRAVISKDPKRPAELKGLSRERIEHDRDVENMRWLMETLDLPTLDQHVNDLPKLVTDRAMWFHEHYKGVAANPLFNVYDSILRDAVERLLQAWNAAMAHGTQYTPLSQGRYSFISLGDAPLTPNRQVAWDEIEAARRDMAECISLILNRIRSAYLEIDVQRTNEQAWKEYVDFHRQIEA
ncbi:nucleotide-binding protein [Sphingomonas sp. TREG-RG-20F-R18-01]|uniref:nucleotide-binding protein n=1 Tax=Sphingomonas sp. TREG-RG-20F-R18-01 TaxID=2914982 RepID=UPI001F5A4136|nr:nucleotide-binding protein [Sphingomonas sp. TREG-RG-20F-R18-01]